MREGFLCNPPPPLIFKDFWVSVCLCTTLSALVEQPSATVPSEGLWVVELWVGHFGVMMYIFGEQKGLIALSFHGTMCHPAPPPPHTHTFKKTCTIFPENISLNIF